MAVAGTPWPLSSPASNPVPCLPGSVRTGLSGTEGPRNYWCCLSFVWVVSRPLRSSLKCEVLSHQRKPLSVSPVGARCLWEGGWARAWHPRACNGGLAGSRWPRCAWVPLGSACCWWEPLGWVGETWPCLEPGGLAAGSGKAWLVSEASRWKQGLGIFPPLPQLTSRVPGLGPHVSASQALGDSGTPLLVFGYAHCPLGS